MRVLALNSSPRTGIIGRTEILSGKADKARMFIQGQYKAEGNTDLLLNLGDGSADENDSMTERGNNEISTHSD